MDYKKINGNYKNIYGAIGYTVLTNNKHKLLIFSDRHDKLKDCKGSKIDMNDLFQDSIDTDSDTQLLLEEVERTKSMENLKLVFDSATHTVDLKDTYIQNQNNIVGVDIRPHLIDFTIDYGRTKDSYTLRKYITEINKFFILQSELFKIKLGDLYSSERLYNNILGIHLLHIHKIYDIFINNYKDSLDKSLNSVINNKLIETINNILSDIMEWYICALIYKNQNTNTILHTGLAHSTHIIDYLKYLYGYTIVHDAGITNINKLNEDDNGCLRVPSSIIKDFIDKKYE